MDNNSDLTPQDTLDSQTPASSETPDNVIEQDTPERESKLSFDESLEPEKLKGLTPEQLEEKRKAFHSDYTKKTQEYAEFRRQVEAEKATRDHEYTQLKSQLSQLQQLATEVLKDPKKLDAYRQVYGPQLGIQQPLTSESIPQFETTAQLVQWHNQQMQTLEQKIRNEVRQENQSFQQKQQELVRWERAVQELNNDQFFQRHSQAIGALVKDPQFGLDVRYRSGQLDEAGVLKEGMARYKALLEPELKRVRDEALTTQQEKRRASTAKPSRPVSTERTEPLSDDELLQRIISRVG